MRARWILAGALVVFNGWMLTSLGRSLTTVPPSCNDAVGRCDSLGAVQSVLSTGAAVFFICFGNALLVTMGPLLARRRPQPCAACLTYVPARAVLCPGCGVQAKRSPGWVAGLKARLRSFPWRGDDPHPVLRLNRVATPPTGCADAVSGDLPVRPVRRF
jgi:hypothetical protein